MEGTVTLELLNPGPGRTAVESLTPALVFLLSMSTREAISTRREGRKDWRWCGVAWCGVVWRGVYVVLFEVTKSNSEMKSFKS